MYSMEVHPQQAGHAGALKYSMRQSQKRVIFGPVFECKISLFAISLQLPTSPDHSLHILTIFTKLYRLIHAIPSHLRLSPT
jgi:hypothetical protein